MSLLKAMEHKLTELVVEVEQCRSEDPSDPMTKHWCDGYRDAVINMQEFLTDLAVTEISLNAVDRVEGQGRFSPQAGSVWLVEIPGRWTVHVATVVRREDNVLTMAYDGIERSYLVDRLVWVKQVK